MKLVKLNNGMVVRLVCKDSKERYFIAKRIFKNEYEVLIKSAKRYGVLHIEKENKKSLLRTMSYLQDRKGVFAVFDC